MDERDQGPGGRTETLRAALRDALQGDEPHTLRELSQVVRASERDVSEHLEHLARSLARGSEQLLISPARCIGCGFVFADRARFKKPGRCPACKSTRIALPRFAIGRA